ncbi:MAG: 2-oxoglutarate dehydrogenase E1 component [Planctomycetota bacterium]
MSPFDTLPTAGSLQFVEAVYAEYLRDPESVSREWRDYFVDLEREEARPTGWRSGPTFRPGSLFRPASLPAAGGVSRADEAAMLQDRVDQLIRAYRVRGHLLARLDPLGFHEPEPVRELEPEFYDLSEDDFDRQISCRTITCIGRATLREILERMRNTYCRSIGVQFMHIDDLDVKHWLQDRMEGTENRLSLSREEQRRILTKLTDATIFEEFIRKKYLGSKSFSLEGAESLIPLLDLAIERAAEHGVDEVVFGMAHRGRLNVLANIIGKSPREIFHEFEDPAQEAKMGSGDVKYHLGYSGNRSTSTGRDIHLSLCFNPSHLEFVNPVAMGRLRAKQDRFGDREHVRGLVILIHGDAAFAGEGIVQETLNLSELSAYKTGGTLHVVVNNQIGFTTPPEQGRSSRYATDVAKMLQIPVFHVNGEDPEAVAQVVRLSLDFRQTFGRDVVIDMYGYRRHGHNEGDEPAFTQPLLYEAIRQRKTVREGYLEHLLQLGGLTRDDADEIVVRRRDELEQHLSAARQPEFTPRGDPLAQIWEEFRGGSEVKVPDVETGEPPERLAELLNALSQVPEGFEPHSKIQRWLSQRRQMAAGEHPLDWAAAEALAFATIAVSGRPVRMTGQDCERGTFSQRHAVVHDVKTGESFESFCHVSPDQAPVLIKNSPLSEAGVAGFEYGYSLECPEGLIAWEAQFGDFCNALQVIIDQFLVSAEDKWKRLSGLVLLLPHGHEGMGPEHSAARIERFLTLAAEDNIQVVQPTTPGQYFHCLRRQVMRPWRKPLIVFTPKSLLRHARVRSELQECSEGTFVRILPDPASPDPKAVKRILLCSGKVYYDLEEHREKLEREDVAILRFEQLYPLRDETVQEALADYADGTQVVWVQEEPENMGASRYLKVRFGDRLLNRFPMAHVTRPESASPATGSASAHRMEQERLLDQAFGLETKSLG